MYAFFFFFFQAEDGIRDLTVTGVQTCALPISHGPHRSAALRGRSRQGPGAGACPERVALFPSARQPPAASARNVRRSEEHTSELQSQSNLVCRLLLEKKKEEKCHTMLGTLVQD